MSLPDQSSVTGGGLHPDNQVLFVNIMDKAWTERLGYQALLVISFQFFSEGVELKHEQIP